MGDHHKQYRSRWVATVNHVRCTPCSTSNRGAFISSGLATGSTADNRETAAGSLGTLFGMLGDGDAADDGTGEG